MSAEAFGDSLLGEVKEESLDELLHDFNKTYVARTPSVGIEPLDKLLQIFQGAGSGQTPPSDWEAASPGKRRNGWDKETVLEISSPSSGCGKSHLLYYMIAVAILPATFNGVALNGAGSAVVFLDTDGRFDVYRLRDIMIDIIRQKANNASESIEGGDGAMLEGEELQAMIHHCLRHVHLFRPQSSESLLSTLQNLEEYLLHSPDHFSSNRPLHTVFLDSATAFYWPDQLQEDMSRDPSAVPWNDRPDKNAIIHSLQRVQRAFSCVIVYTAWGLTARSSDQAVVPSFKPPWPAFPSLRVVVDQDSVRPFGPDMTIDEARQNAPARHSAVVKGKFSGWVDPWDKEGWAPGISERLSKTEGKGLFSFWVTDEGVAFEER